MVNLSKGKTDVLKKLNHKSVMDVVQTQQRNKIHPHKFTLWVAIASIVMMFAGLTSAYIVKSSTASWEVIQKPAG